jgi:hypothetical protein
MALRRVYLRNFLFKFQSGEYDAPRQLSGKSEIADIV